MPSSDLCTWVTRGECRVLNTPDRCCTTKVHLQLCSLSLSSGAGSVFKNTYGQSHRYCTETRPMLVSFPLLTELLSDLFEKRKEFYLTDHIRSFSLWLLGHAALEPVVRQNIITAVSYRAQPWQLGSKETWGNAPVVPSRVLSQWHAFLLLGLSPKDSIPSRSATGWGQSL